MSKSVIKDEFKVVALGNRVLIRRDSPEEKSEGGIIMTKSGDIPGEGVVMSVGPDVKCDVKIGDRVLVPEHGVDIVVRGLTFAIMTDKELYVRIV